jgi:hypothetical protein
MGKNTIRIADFKEQQYNIEELIDYLRDLGEDMVTALVVFRAKGGLFFVAGSKDRDYNFLEMNWDLDRVKISLMDPSRDEEEDE